MRLLEKRKASLSVAVLPKDDFSPGGEIKGEFRIRLKGNGRHPLKHRTGCFLFLDLPEGEYTITTESKFYIETDIAVDTGKLDHGMPVVEMTLKPNPDYPFPTGATLIKGTVTDTEGVPLAGAVLKVRKRDESTVTDKNGAFVLYFKDIEDGKLKVRLYITKEGFRKKRRTYTVEEGETVEVSIRLKSK